MSKLVVSVSQSAVVQGESAILGCNRCTSAATVPFWQVLDGLRSYAEEDIAYILPALASCPKCRAPINEHTLVEPKPIKKGVFIASLIRRLIGSAEKKIKTPPALEERSKPQPAPRRRREDFIRQ